MKKQTRQHLPGLFLIPPALSGVAIPAPAGQAASPQKAANEAGNPDKAMTIASSSGTRDKDAIRLSTVYSFLPRQRAV